MIVPVHAQIVLTHHENDVLSLVEKTLDSFLDLGGIVVESTGAWVVGFHGSVAGGDGLASLLAKIVPDWLEVVGGVE